MDHGYPDVRKDVRLELQTIIIQQYHSMWLLPKLYPPRHAHHPNSHMPVFLRRLCVISLARPRDFKYMQTPSLGHVSGDARAAGLHRLFDPLRELAAEVFSTVRAEFPADRYAVLKTEPITLIWSQRCLSWSRPGLARLPS
jgi:hypothetical protein